MPIHHVVRASAAEKAMQTGNRPVCLFWAAAAALVVLSGGKAVAQSRPDLGTWKLNVAKSKSSRDRHQRVTRRAWSGGGY
jgi:hypothetical protein